MQNALKLDRKSQAQAFTELLKDRIYKHNRERMRETNPLFEKERSLTSDEKLVLCGKGKGFYSKSYFSRHKKICTGDLAEEPNAVSIKLLTDCTVPIDAKDNFKSEIVYSLANDEIGNICKTDSSIIAFGSWQYRKLNGRKDKKAEVRKS